MCFRLDLCIPSYSGRSSGLPFLRKFFVRLTVLPLHPIFDKFRTRLPDAFHHCMPNDNFHCETPLKNAKFDLLGSEKKPAGKSSGFEQRLVHCDSTIGYGMQNTIYESLVLLIRWWIHGTVCLSANTTKTLKTRFDKLGTIRIQDIYNFKA